MCYECVDAINYTQIQRREAYIYIIQYHNFTNTKYLRGHQQWECQPVVWMGYMEVKEEI